MPGPVCGAELHQVRPDVAVGKVFAVDVDDAQAQGRAVEQRRLEAGIVEIQSGELVPVPHPVEHGPFQPGGIERAAVDRCAVEEGVRNVYGHARTGEARSVEVLAVEILAVEVLTVEVLAVRGHEVGGCRPGAGSIGALSTSEGESEKRRQVFVHRASPRGAEGR